MVHWVKALAAKPDGFSFIPGTHVMEEENSHKLYSGFHTYAVVYLHAGTHTLNTYSNLLLLLF